MTSNKEIYDLSGPVACGDCLRAFGGHMDNCANLELARRDAGLGVKHIWTNRKCPAYLTLTPEDCRCNAYANSIRDRVLVINSDFRAIFAQED